MEEKLNLMKEKEGFIAALDQSGGSSKKTLKLYGILEDKYKDEEEMFTLIHDMRTRIITNKNFTGDKIVGVILFEQTMNKEIDGVMIAKYLWDNKNIVSFLKIDKGLEKEENGVSMMKEIPDLENTLEQAKRNGIFGTKMRSVIHEANKDSIKRLIAQQFEYAKRVINCSLIPIIEPEISITSPNKLECEKIMKEEIDKQLLLLNDNDKVMFKFTPPEENDFYLDYTNNDKVVRVVFLSGGYNRKEACRILSKNHNVIASFSRAFLEGLNVNQSEEEFSDMLQESINQIYDASIT